MATRKIRADYKGFGESIKIALNKCDTDFEVILPPAELTFGLDGNGDFVDKYGVQDGLLNLWCNAGSRNGSKYRVTEESGFQWDFVLEAGDGSVVSLMELRAANAEMR